MEEERPAAVSGRPEAPRLPLRRQSDFRKLWTGQSISVFGDQFTLLAIPLAAAITLEATRPGVLGIILGGAAVGGILGAAASSRVTRRLGVGRSMIVGSTFFSAPLLLVPAATGTRWLVALMLFAALFLSAFGVMILDVNGNSLNAALAPERLRARITGAHRVINYGVRPIGAMVGGVAGSWIGLRPTMWLAALGTTLAVLWLLAPPVRTLQTLPDAAA